MSQYETPDYNLKRKNAKSRQQIDSTYTHNNPAVKTPETNKLHSRSFSTRLQETSVKKAQQRRVYEELKQNTMKPSEIQKKHNFLNNHNSVQSLDISKQISEPTKMNPQLDNRFNKQQQQQQECNTTKRIKYVKRQEQQAQQTKVINSAQKSNFLNPQNHLIEKQLNMSQSVRSIKNNQTNFDEESLLHSEKSFFNNPPQPNQYSQIQTNTGRVQRLFQKKGAVQDSGNSPSYLAGKAQSPGSKSKNRSLSKSFSEKKLNIQGVEQRMISDDLNKTQAPFIAYQMSQKHEFEMNHGSHQVNQTTVGIDGMILMQQETPSSSSNPTQFIENEAFQDFMNEYNSPVKQKTHEVHRQDTNSLNDIISKDKIELDVIMEFIQAEEERLNIYSQMVNNGQLLELQAQLPLIFQFAYIDLISSVECVKERPKFFAQQLQVNLIISNTLVQVFTTPYLQKFSHKFRTVYTNIHQNFLLLIDQILNCCNANPKENQAYVLLRKLIMKKLKNKQKSQRLTQFRQSNEININIIKKICKSMTQSANGSGNSGQGLSGNQSSQNLLETQLIFNSDYQKLSEEIKEILRIYDKITITEIIQRLEFKDKIIKKKTLQSPQKRNSSNYLKHSSPKASPRTGLLGSYSPSSNRSKQSNNSANKAKENKKSPSSRQKLVKPTFYYMQPSKSKRNIKSIDKDSSYDLLENYSVTTTSKMLRNAQESSQPINQFILPETMQFMKQIDNQNLTTIYPDDSYSTSTNLGDKSISTVDQRGGKSQSKLAQYHQKQSPKPPINSKLNNVQSNKQNQGVKSPNVSAQKSGIGTGTKNLPKRSTQSRQGISRENSQMSLENSVKEQLDPIHRLALSRENSAISKKSLNTQLSTNVQDQNGIISPTKRKQSVTQYSQRPMSRQLQSNNQPGLIQARRKTTINSNLATPQDTPQVAKHNLARPLSKQLNTNSKQSISTVKRTKLNLKSNDNQSVSDYQSEITINSVNCTPMKQKSTGKDSLINTQTKQPQKQTVLVKSNNGKTFSLAQANTNITQKKKIATVQSKITSKNHNTSPIRNQDRVLKEKERLTEQVKSSDLNLVGFEVISSNDETSSHAPAQGFDFYSEQKAKARNSLVTDISQSLTNDKDFEETFKKGESKLDKLLNEMVDNNTEKVPRSLQFGNLIEQNIGSLDLKKEMEKLKLLDEERKMQKRISLKITHSASVQETGDTNSPLLQQKPSQTESPSKKIFLGEFDETKEDDFGIVNLSNDVNILSKEHSKKHQQEDQLLINDDDIAVEVFDFTDYVTQKTGMEDPFPDHLDPNEEKTPNKTGQSSEHHHNNAQKEEEDEYQKMRAAVKIPYLPPVEKSNSDVYTLVLDLDETLIHLECDDDAQEEDEQVYYLIRPGAIKFLNELSKYYELVVFTAAMPDYADWILDNVDRHRIIKHRLYRQHTTPHEDYAIKDLRNLGRPLERTIIIDNLAENFVHTTPENGIWVESWYDDMDDQVMDLLTPFLREIVTSGVKDVRKLLSKGNKENVIYRCLEEGKDIPSICTLLKEGEYSRRKLEDDQMEIE